MVSKKREKKAEADCKKLGGRYDADNKVCVRPPEQALKSLLVLIVLAVVGMAVVGGITLYTASAVFNLATFTWGGALLVGLMVFLWVWIYVKAKRMAKA